MTLCNRLGHFAKTNLRSDLCRNLSTLHGTLSHILVHQSCELFLDLEDPPEVAGAKVGAVGGMAQLPLALGLRERNHRLAGVRTCDVVKRSLNLEIVANDRKVLRTRLVRRVHCIPRAIYL